ncbi:MAG: hypothetical protein JNM93_11750 [Bacteriovoracaceae bacterium]|nr:hypothetical protein [Bacteriovoracaceae bacterium]
MKWMFFVFYSLLTNVALASGCGSFMSPEQKLFTLAQFDLTTPLNQLVTKAYTGKVSTEEVFNILHAKYMTEVSEVPTYIIRKHRRDKITDADFTIISHLATDYPDLESVVLLNEQTLEFSNGLVRSYMGTKTERFLLQTSTFIQVQIPSKDFQEMFADLMDLDEANWSYARLITPNTALTGSN